MRAGKYGVPQASVNEAIRVKAESLRASMGAEGRIARDEINKHRVLVFDCVRRLATAAANTNANANTATDARDRGYGNVGRSRGWRSRIFCRRERRRQASRAHRD